MALVPLGWIVSIVTVTLVWSRTQVWGSTLDNEVDLRKVNNRPIIGILAQELGHIPSLKKYNSFIAASYVKFLESAGARVAPVWINQTKAYYDDIVSSINGVLFPGGSSSFFVKHGYAEAGTHIYNAAKRINEKGDHFPLWGTCLGFELLAFEGANLSNPLTKCSSSNVNLPLNFIDGFNSSKLFRSAPVDVINILQNENVTPNFHHLCLTPENLTQHMGDINWQIMSVNKDSNGLKFISSMESRSMPFYGVQFHPEKVMFEWEKSQNTAHSYSAVTAAQYFSNFFVNESRKNSHSFQSSSEEQRALIYNFQPTYTEGIKGSMNEQMYLFK